jgi:rfaE bifunctional protein kinase chain/domain
MKKIKVAVIGDVILDKYSFGRVDRISPEAPIPIILVDKEEYKPGGAGNVAANIAALGAEVDLFGIVGDDYYKDYLISSLKKYNVNPIFMVDKNRPTILKQRCIASNQQLLRVDYESGEKIQKHHIEFIKKSFSKYDAIIISDYAKGMLCKELMDFLNSTKIPIYVDPKPENKALYHGVFFITPNAKECIDMAHTEDEVEAAKILKNQLNTNVLVTRGKSGIALIRLDKKDAQLFDTIAKEVVDVTGAGDVVIATFVFFHLQGLSYERSAELANKAGGISVTKIGCYQVKIDELIDGGNI